ncbi:excinuclease ABC subunit C, partial [Candidatus Parcubacteria bacterium]|nr:excinuclease ABC subunit C [Candidatus Parcubacteria bacterium]
LPQVNRAKKILKENKFDIPVVGIAKGPARKKNEFILGSKKKDFVDWVNENQGLLIRVRDEAHRFAIKYQRILRKIN